MIVEQTTIPGLLVVRLDVHEDARGWFKESWQREKMVAAGLPDFGPVQNNVSYNARRGATRGIHTEPWDKFVTVTTGRVFGAWVDMRAGDSFGATFSVEIDPGVAVFVPRGVGDVEPGPVQRDGAGELLLQRPAELAVRADDERGHWPRAAYVASTWSLSGRHHDSLARYQSTVAARPSRKSVYRGFQPSSSRSLVASIA